MKKALNLGCGRNFVESTPETQWINIDVIKDFKADLYHDLREPLPFECESIDFIKAHDVVEHFDKYEVGPIFKGWVKLLKKGGKIEVKVPNMDAIKDFKGNTFRDLIFGERMFSGADTSHFGLHKNIFNHETIQDLFGKYGVFTIDIKDIDGTNLICTGERR